MLRPLAASCRSQLIPSKFVVLQDYFTKWPFISVMSSVEAGKLCERLEREVFCNYGGPEELIGDFKEFEEFLRRNVVHQRWMLQCALFSSDRNSINRIGPAELVEVLRSEQSFTMDTYNSCSRYRLLYRCAKHCSTGSTLPFELLQVHQPRLGYEANIIDELIQRGQQLMKSMLSLARTSECSKQPGSIQSLQHLRWLMHLLISVYWRRPQCTCGKRLKDIISNPTRTLHQDCIIPRDGGVRPTFNIDQLKKSKIKMWMLPWIEPYKVKW